MTDPRVEQVGLDSELISNNLIYVKSSDAIHCMSMMQNEYSIRIQIRNLSKDTILLWSNLTSEIMLPSHYTLCSIGGQYIGIENDNAMSQERYLFPFDYIEFEVPFVSNYEIITSLEFRLDFHYETTQHGSGFESHELRNYYGFYCLPKCPKSFLHRSLIKKITPYDFPPSHYGFGI